MPLSPDANTEARRGQRPAESDDALHHGAVAAMRGLGPCHALGGYGEETRLEVCVVAGGGDVREDDRRARIMAAVTEPDTTAGAGELSQRLCRFAVDEMALSGCAVVLMSGAESASVLAGAGRHARTVTGLQTELGEGPCLQAHACGIPVLLSDLAAGPANRWPAFAAAALAAGVHAEFSLPLAVGPCGIGTSDLCRDRPGPLSKRDKIS